jgi:hypothetical protein
MRPRTAMLMWTAMVRPTLEYACELWSHGITASQEEKLEAMQVKFLKKILQLPSGTASVFVRVENGVERMRARWDKLTIGFLQRVTLAERGRLSRVAVDILLKKKDQWANSWGSRVVTMLASAAPGRPAFLDITSLDCITELCREIEFDVDERENEMCKAEARRMRSTRGGLLALKKWGKVSENYAFSKTHVGRVGSRFPEPYLDKWTEDKRGSRLKLLARAGQLPTSARIASRAGVGGRAAACKCCNESPPETLCHFMLKCPALEDEREVLMRKLLQALRKLESAAPPGERISVGDFMSSSDHGKVRIILGKQTGDPTIDVLIDRACRKYLRNSWAKRRKLR